MSIMLSKIQATVLTLLLLVLLSSCKSKQTIDATQKQSDTDTSIDISHIIYSNTFGSMDNGHTGFVLDVCTEGVDCESKILFWEKEYYGNLFHHHLDEDPDFMDKVAEILNVATGGMNELMDQWPEDLSDDQFNQLKRLTGKSFVTMEPYEATSTQEYILAVGYKFWDFKKESGSDIMIDIISPYERKYSRQEMIFSDREKAMAYGCIIYENLCHTRDPDNSYYYNKRIIDQFDALEEPERTALKDLNLSYYFEDGLPYLQLNTYLPDRQSAYDSIFEEKTDGLALHVKAVKAVPMKPFHIIPLPVAR